MAILRVRDENGNIIEIPAIKGEKGDKGDPGDAASVDIQLNGTSIVQDGVANIPYGSLSKLGVIRVKQSHGMMSDGSGYIYPLAPSATELTNRTGYRWLSSNGIDRYVKAAMCDGKGEAWTVEEQLAAQTRMGIDVWEEVADVTLEEEVGQIDINFEHSYKEIYVFLSQEKCETKITGSWIAYPKMINDDNQLSAYILNITSGNFNGFIHCINHGNMWIERFGGAINPQNNTTTVNITGKVVDKVFNSKLVNKDDLNFYGFKSYTTTNKGTRIRVLGVRA